MAGLYLASSSALSKQTSNERNPTVASWEGIEGGHGLRLT